MPSIADAFAQTHATGLPVLFADTCSLVDVIRAPIRPSKLRGCVAGATELLQLLTVPPFRCVLVAASFVRGEWQTHAPHTTDDLKKHLTGLDEWATEFHDSCALLGLGPSFGRPTYGGVGLADGLHNLSKQLLDSAIHLDAHNDTNMKAFDRAINCIPPSRKGGEVKDCTIIEECLEVCRQLRAGGFARKLVFCTSNTDDYCESGSDLLPGLAVDFSLVGLGFTTNLPWAVHEIKT